MRGGPERAGGDVQGLALGVPQEAGWLREGMGWAGPGRGRTRNRSGHGSGIGAAKGLGRVRA
ncbi:hypothetical protein AcV7_009371 [Taiwanofungus camphoratus]|nr:hypothetical protein AcV7_009371 [Antrodia cinnamomea]